MANLVVTATANTIAVDFGAYSTAANISKGTWRKDKIIKFTLADSDLYVTAIVQGGGVWNLVYASSGNNMIVDTVAGAGPSSNADLYTKLIALIA